MKQSLDDAAGELKRADHLIFVSLKYTRTVDVIKSIVERLINSIEFMIDALIDYGTEQKRISDVPQNVIQKSALIRKIYTDEKIQEMILFYLKLRQIAKAEFSRSSEYRRHVTMSVVLEGIPLNIDIDLIKLYFEAAKAHLEYVTVLIEGKQEQ